MQRQVNKASLPSQDGDQIRKVSSEEGLDSEGQDQLQTAETGHQVGRDKLGLVERLNTRLSLVEKFVYLALMC